jgi:type IV pilus assembly protein PilY1
MNNRISIIVAGAALLAGLPATGPAQTPGYSIFRDNFTGASSENQWYFSNGACLTAGTGSASSPNYIPSCKSVFSSYYSQLQPGQGNDPGYADGALLGGINGKAGSAGTLPDPVGSGALRFTNANNAFPYYGEWENGSIVSVGTFNAGQGVQITFKTVTYRGDAGGAGKDGADGIAFFLIDGTKNPGNTVGNVGGSLGYSCSNINGPPFDGLIGAYLGLGIDEYGNFLHGAQ